MSDGPDLDRVTIRCVECEKPIGTTREIKRMIEEIDEMPGVICDECNPDVDI